MMGIIPDDARQGFIYHFILFLPPHGLMYKVRLRFKHNDFCKSFICFTLTAFLTVTDNSNETLCIQNDKTSLQHYCDVGGELKTFIVIKDICQLMSQGVQLSFPEMDLSHSRIIYHSPQKEPSSIPPYYALFKC